MFYIGLHGGVEYAGWDAGGAPVHGRALPENWTREAATAHAAHGGGNPRAAASSRSPPTPTAAASAIPATSAASKCAAAATVGGGRMSVTFTRHQQRRHRCRRSATSMPASWPGPGSGKTTVLVEYFPPPGGRRRRPAAHPRHHFHRKGRRQHAQEAGRRPSRTIPETRARLERAWVSTVHGFCARLLRENAVFAGVDPEFAVARRARVLALAAGSMPTRWSDLFAEQAGRCARG